MVNRRIIIPILNRVSLRWVPFYLTDNIYFDEIAKEDYAVINGQPNEYTVKINAKTKCIFIVNEKFTDIDSYIKNISTALRFMFNMFSSQDFIVLSFGFLIEENSGDTLHNLELSMMSQNCF
jgi:hypothetical protein